MVEIELANRSGVEVDNRSGVEVDEDAAVELARAVLSGEGVEDGELGIAFVPPDEIRELKREHLGIDEATDVLSFPIDGRDPLPDGVPRQLGDAILCPRVTGEAWRRPLVHGLLHLHGVTHDLDLEVVTPADTGGLARASYSVRSTLNRQSFGLHWNQDLDVGGVVVGDEVAFSADVNVVRANDERKSPA